MERIIDIPQEFERWKSERSTMPDFRDFKRVEQKQDHDNNPFGNKQEFSKVQSAKHKLAIAALDENPEVCLAALEELRNTLKVKNLTHKLARAAYGETSSICMSALDKIANAILPHGNNVITTEGPIPDTPTRLQTLWDSMQPRKKFTVFAKKSPGEKLGISICPGDGRALVITYITDGLVQLWNAKQPRHLQIEVGDQIVSVNGKSESLSSLRLAMENAMGTFCFEVEPHMEFAITITRGENDRLGLNVTNKPNDMTMLITGVVDGIINVWNASQKGPMVLAGDRIRAINGETAQGSILRKMINELRGEIRLTITRVKDISQFPREPSEPGTPSRNWSQWK